MTRYARRFPWIIWLLALVSGCGPGTPANPYEVRVTLTEFSVQTSTRSFTPGVPYRLTIDNRGQVNHELRIGAQGAQGGTGEIAWVDQMTLQPGTAHTLEVTFPASAAGASLELACHLPAHYEFGMHLPIAVR